LGELVELERPVFDREALRGVERDELAERLCAGHHLDRPVVEVARDRRVLRRRPGRDQSDVLDQHDPRVGVSRDCRLVPVGVDVLAVAGAERLRALGDAFAQRREIVDVGVVGNPERQTLGVHEVVGAGGADGDEMLGLDGGDELDRALRRVDGEQLGPLAGDGAADGGQQRVQQLGACVVGHLLGARVGSAEARRVAGALVDERDRPVDDLDRLAVSLLGRLAPDDEAVLGKHDELEAGVRARGLADLLGEREAGPDVRDPGRGLAEALLHEALPVGRPGEHVDAVRVGVVHVRRRHERVQQRLDRGAWHRGVDLAASEVGDHLLVAHLRALHQRQQLVNAQSGEVLRSHRREVAAGALDPHHRHLAAGVVHRGALGRGVAAAEVRDGAVGAQQVRGEHELGKDVVVAGVVAGPEVVDLVDEWGDGAHRVISCRVSRSVAMRSA
jgi:hypothetical protein